MLTHKELVVRAGQWLRKTKRCGVVLTEFRSWAPEEPDAIGWTGGAYNSYLIECKTSRSDFFSDKTKPGRAGLRARCGMGRERYYMTEKGVLSVELIEKHQPAFGLLEVAGRQVRVRRKAIPYGHEARYRELPVLYSYARRIDQYGLSLDDAQRAVQLAAGAPG